jgi:hypothetical protein
MGSFSFPTQRQRGPASYVATVIQVYEGFNAKYGPNGRDGLYIKIRYDTSGSNRDIFYPTPPAAKSDRLLQALQDEVGLDMDKIGWKGLEGYTFRWANDEEEREIFDRDTQARRKVKVRLEYPLEIMSEPEVSAAANSPVPEQASSSLTDNSASPASDDANYEAFKDEILELANGKTNREFRLVAAQTKAVREYPNEFRQKLNRGVVIDELKEAGRLEEVAGTNGESVFKTT